MARFRLEYVAYGLFGAGGLAALAGDKLLSMPALRDVGVAVALAGLVVFGADMILKRRADIATRYSSTTSPRFHVFRGWPAVAWGAAIALFAGTLAGYALIRLTAWTAAEDFFRQRPGLLIVLGGTIVAAFGAGSAGRATYRQGDEETAVPRRLDRIGGVLTLVFGLAVIGIGLLRLFAPDLLDGLKRALVDGLLRRFR